MSLNTIKAVLILNSLNGNYLSLNAKKGWSDAARKKAAMARKLAAKKGASKSGGMKSKPKLDFYEARRQAGRGSRLIEDQVRRAYDHRETSTELMKTKPKLSEKHLLHAEKLEGMIQRNEKRLKKLIKRYRIDRNPN